MIYQVGIGESDNCYIITGGLPLTAFSPTLVNGTATPCEINVDSADETIFAPYIKQSLKVNLYKENETDYAEVIAGNDNETYGIYIEDGELEWVGAPGDEVLQLTAGRLKFLGTLALESYIEEYKNTSIVSFTFHDRIGLLSDEKFEVNGFNFMCITDIFAECLASVQCSLNLHLEWPYEISSSSDPQEYFLDITGFYGKPKIELLEQVLLDHGLQLKVNFERHANTELFLCGAVQIISVTNHPNATLSYWDFVQSHVSGRYTYAGSFVSDEVKTIHLLASDNIEFLNNEATLELERVASNVIAVNQSQFKDNILPENEISEKYCYGTSLVYYGPWARFESADIYTEIKSVLDTYTLNTFSHPRSIVLDGILGVRLERSNGSNFISIALPQIIVNNSEVVSDTMNLVLKMTLRGIIPSGLLANACQVWVNFLIKEGTNYFIWGDAFTSQSQLVDGGAPYIITLTNDYYDFDVTHIFTPSSDAVLVPVLTLVGQTSSVSVHIKSFSIQEVFIPPLELPATITLNTSLSGNNRKNINLDSVFMNRPDIAGSHLQYNNLIADSNIERPTTIDYLGASQTLLAHLSDQYGWQYDGNRWNVNATCKSMTTMNICGQFRLDDKILMLLNGSYDCRRKELKGKFGQVLELSTVGNNLLDDNFVPLTWDNGNNINLN